MNYEELLSQYRQRYSFKKAEAEEAVSPWDSEIESLKDKEDADKEDVWAHEVKSNLATPTSYSQQDKESFAKFLEGDKRVSKHRQSIENALEQLLQMSLDPNNPQVTPEVAQQMFVEAMEKHVYPDFQDEDEKESE